MLARGADGGWHRYTHRHRYRHRHRRRHSCLQGRLSQDARQRGVVKETRLRLCMTSQPLFRRGRNFQLQKRRVAVAAKRVHGPPLGDYK